MIAALVLAALCCTVGGAVESSGGAPIPHAHVVLTGRGSVAGDTDMSGRFSLEVPAGAYDLAVSAPGFASLALRGVTVHQGSAFAVTLEPLDRDSPRTIGRVVVDGRLALSRGEIPSQRISREDLDAAGAVFALDAIERVPSATIARPLGGNRSAAAVVALRGPDPSETLVALYGQVLNNSNTGDFDLALFPVAPLQRIDVSEGLGPAENRAANTIGGEINLQTLQPTRERHDALAASLGSFDTTSLRAQSTGRSGRLGYALAGGTLHSRGYVHDYVAWVGGRETTLGSSVFAQSALATLTYDVSPHAGVRLRYFALADRRDESAAQNAPADVSQEHAGGTFLGPGEASVTQGLRALLFSGRMPLGKGSLVASYATSGATSGYAGGPAASPYDLSNNDVLDTLSLGWERSTANVDVSFGAYARGESLDERAAFEGDTQRQRSGALDLRVALHAAPHLRLAVAAFHTHYSTFGTSLDGRFGATYDLDVRSVVRASAGTGFRPPLLAERYVVPLETLLAAGAGALDANCVASNGNAAERPEHATAYELGYGRRLSDVTSLDATLYRTNLRDAIEVAYPLDARCPVTGVALAGQAIPINVGNVMYQGATLRLTRSLGPVFVHLGYGLNVAHPVTLPASVSNPTSGANLVPGQQFQGIPIQSATAGARYTHTGLHADAELAYKGRNNELGDGAFATLAGALGTQFGALDVTLTCRNITSAESGRFTRLGLGLPYPSPLVPGGSLRTDRLSLEPATFLLTATLRR